MNAPTNLHADYDNLADTAERLRRRPAPPFTPIRERLSMSFEFFPPATDKADASLWASIEALAPLDPTFISVTYGAGGSTRSRTHATVKRVVEQTSLAPAAHLTCVGASREAVDEVVRDYIQCGVRHIVALRGDAPEGHGHFRAHPYGYRDSAELVAGIRRLGDVEVSVGAYPETHPDARSPQADLDHLKRKIDAGATRAITQFFFAPETYLRFLDRARAAGITVPIVPGILPVTNFTRLVFFAAKCGATLPPWLADLFDGLDEAPEIRQLVAATIAAELCTRLVDQGVRELHFYTLNRSALVLAIARILGVKAHPDRLEPADFRVAAESAR